MSEDPSRLLAEAIALHQQGALAAAEVVYQRVLAAAPRHADALHLLGVLTAQRGEPEAAIALLRAAIAAAPGTAVFHANLGRACKTAGQHAEALANFDRAIALGSTDPGVFNDRGNVLLTLDRNDAALDSFDRALALRPDFADALNNRGNALRLLDRNAAALDSFDRAITLRPDTVEALINRGNVLQDLSNFALAVESYDRVLTLHRDHVDALANRGAALRALGRHDAAMADYDRALALRPDHAPARYGRALCLLQMGALAEAWAQHEWRWRMPRMATQAARFAQLAGPGAVPLGVIEQSTAAFGTAPLASSAPGVTAPGAAPPGATAPDAAASGAASLAGTTVLLHAEQGLGDTLQFCRYVAPVAARGARVILQVGPPLLRLLGTLDGVAQTIAIGDPLPSFDRHCWLMSLPLAFGTTLETIPPPAHVSVAADRVAGWRRRLATLPRPHVGLVWAGSPNTRRPESRAANRRRSIALDQLAPLAAVQPVSFISLQKGKAAQQAATPPPGMALLDFTEELDDFADTAALVAALDLVISVDTAVAHLAGTLGKQVWILTQFDADWRWLLGRTDSPWYPCARLFRQQTLGDWPSVIAEVAAALHRHSTADVSRGDESGPSSYPSRNGQ